MSHCDGGCDGCGGGVACLWEERDRLLSIIVRAGRMAESERAGMTVQILREVDQKTGNERRQ